MPLSPGHISGGGCMTQGTLANMYRKHLHFLMLMDKHTKQVDWEGKMKHKKLAQRKVVFFSCIDNANTPWQYCTNQSQMHLNFSEKLSSPLIKKC